MKNLFKLKIKTLNSCNFKNFIQTKHFSIKNYIDKNQIDKIMPYSDLDSVNFSSFNAPINENFIYTEIIKNKFSLAYVNLENILDVS